jgi:protein SCO1
MRNLKRRIFYIQLIALLLLISAFNACSHKEANQENAASCCSTDKLPQTDKAVSISEMSVYQLDGNWRDQNGKQLSLKDFAGKPVVLTMFFTHCEYACPLLVHDMKTIEEQLDANMAYTFVLVSFDDKRDTPERLKSYAESQGVGNNWVFLHGDADQIKELSIMLNINYEALENGQFAHSNRKLVLDQGGEIVFQQDGLQTKAEPVVKALKDLM